MLSKLERHFSPETPVALGPNPAQVMLRDVASQCGHDDVQYFGPSQHVLVTPLCAYVELCRQLGAFW